MIEIRQCSAADAVSAVKLYIELMDEIMMRTTGSTALIEKDEALETYRRGLEGGLYRVFLAVDSTDGEAGVPVGFISLCESFSLYAEGSFGIIQELYVAREYRSRKLGELLVARAAAYGRERQWKRLEVNTPALPEFERSLQFYERCGFSVTGGRKLKLGLPIAR